VLGTKDGKERKMTTERTELATIEEIPLSLPTKAEAIEQLDRTTFIAQQLANLVEERHWFATVQGKKYLEVEAWQFIGFQANINADIEYTRAVTNEAGEVVAYESKAVLTRNGLPFSSGIMECGMDSFPTRGKQGREKDKAAQSASQTWAISKAYRNRLSFIAKMAGYEPTPADEMRQTEASSPTELCPIHKVAWFKRGRMRDFAHQTEDGGWCNKGDVLKQLKQDAADFTKPSVDKETGEIVDVAPAFKNKGEVMAYYREQYNLTTPQITAHYPEGRGLQELTIEDVVEAAENAVRENAPF